MVMKYFSTVGVSCIIGEVAIEKIVENRRACQKVVGVAIAIDGIGVGVRATQMVHSRFSHQDRSQDDV
jgi:hypothetical protein